MKKLMVSLLTLFLFACSEDIVSIGEGKYEFMDRNGDKQSVTVQVKLNNDDIIKSISIDESYIVNGKKTTKKAMGDDYGMDEVDGSVGEWDEQIEHLEEMLIGSDGTIALNNEGIPTDEDVLSGCTIDLTNIQKAVSDAVNNAKLQD